MILDFRNCNQYKCCIVEFPHFLASHREQMSVELLSWKTKLQPVPIGKTLMKLVFPSLYCCIYCQSKTLKITNVTVGNKSEIYAAYPCKMYGIFIWKVIVCNIIMQHSKQILIQDTVVRRLNVANVQISWAITKE